MHKLSKTQYLRLQGYLYDIQISGRGCVFSDLSGHIDVLNIRIGASKSDYNTTLYGSFSNWIYLATDYQRPESDEDFVTRIIEEINEALLHSKKKIELAKKEAEGSERKQYEELKLKYGGGLNV